MRLALALLVVVLPLSACACASEVDAMNELAARAKQVARAVHFTASVPDAPDGEDLVRQASVNDPAMLAPLAGHYVTAKRVDKASVLLVCDKDRTRALVEDSGCTQPIDRHRWQDSPPTGCDFSLDPVTVCPPRR